MGHNTKDILYIGAFKSDLFKGKLIRSGFTARTTVPLDCPRLIGEAFMFDCHGTRYSFRIKKFKQYEIDQLQMH